MTAAPILLSLVMVTGALPNATAPLPSNERALLAALTNQGVPAGEAPTDEASPEPAAPATSPSVENPTPAPTPAEAVIPAGELARIAQEKAEQARVALEAAENARIAEQKQKARTRMQAERARLAKQKAARTREARKEARKEPAAASVTDKEVASEEISAAIRMAGFAIVLALVLFGAAFFLKRIRTTQADSKGGTGLTVLESMWIGKGQRIILVQVGSQQLLLSATSTGITSLAVFPNGTRNPEARTPEARPVEARPLTPTKSANVDQSFQSMIQDEMRDPTPTEPVQMDAPAPVSQEHVQKLIRRLNTL